MCSLTSSRFVKQRRTCSINSMSTVFIKEIMMKEMMMMMMMMMMNKRTKRRFFTNDEQTT